MERARIGGCGVEWARTRAEGVEAGKADETRRGGIEMDRIGERRLSSDPDPFQQRALGVLVARSARTLASLFPDGDDAVDLECLAGCFSSLPSVLAK
jgi:hypothetical protein